MFLLCSCVKDKAIHKNLEEFDLGSCTDDYYINKAFNIMIKLNEDWKVMDKSDLLEFSKIDKNDAVIGYNKDQVYEFKNSNKSLACPIAFKNEDTFSKIFILIKKTNSDDMIYDAIKDEVSDIERHSERKFNISKDRNVKIANTSFEFYKIASPSYYEQKIEIDYYIADYKDFAFIIKAYFTNDIGQNEVNEFLKSIKSID